MVRAPVSVCADGLVDAEWMDDVALIQIARSVGWNTAHQAREPHVRQLLGEEDLLPGDVLLCQGSSLIDRLIRLFDGSEYSHAALFDGANVDEAVARGVVSDSLATAIKDQEFVDVYRFRSDSGMRLGSTGLPVDPILIRAKYYIDQKERYAYESILLLAILATTRRLPVIGWIPGLARLIRTILDTAVDVIDRLIAGGREPMICSEFVYRCYAEAGSSYDLRIVGADILARHSIDEALMRGGLLLSTQPVVDHEVTDLLAAAHVFLKRYASARLKLSAGATRTAVSTSAFAVADFVTPRDLKTSPNLTRIGRFK